MAHVADHLSFETLADPERAVADPCRVPHGHQLRLEQTSTGGPKSQPSWPSTTAGVDEFWFCGSSVIVWRAAGVVVASPTKRGCDRGRAALPRRDARGAGAPREP